MDNVGTIPLSTKSKLPWLHVNHCAWHLPVYIISHTHAKGFCLDRNRQRTRCLEIESDHFLNHHSMNFFVTKVTVSQEAVKQMRG